MAPERRAEEFAKGGEASFEEIAEIATELRHEGHYGAIAPMLIAAGRRALYDDWSQDRREALADLLCDHQQFGYARRLFGRLRREGDSETLRQRHAFATYKDMEVPVARRLERALEILSEGDEPLSAGTDAETLGIAGAIYKRRWMLEARRADLESSLWHYERGYAQKGDARRLYAGINAAFVADQVAALEREEPGPASQKARLRARADEIRKEIVAHPPGDEDRWADATVGEALFGLGRTEEACARLEKAGSSTPEFWRLESTAMQLAALSELRGIDDDAAAKALEALLGRPGGALRRGQSGKVGLALSGGGFRASLFHVGVLARLAECDVLRRVEVLSCVSGGSIIGAFYYLKLRHLLQEKADADLTRDDYVKLVGEVTTEFLAGVRKNLRHHLVTNVTADLKMLTPGYSRTDRVAELLEKMFFAKVADGDSTSDGSNRQWRMTDLFVTPQGSEQGFSLSHENWMREAKVPVLVLNATTLNTGHNWQFTASWMGECPVDVDEKVDASRRLRRVYYRDAPPAHREIPLARAVAASAAVPSLFPPITLADLYDGVDVELVDGGLHDNQGIASLLDQDCTAILVSDASGQTPEDEHPGRRIDQVAKRSNSVLMARVRGAQYGELASRLRLGVLRGLMIVHLKKGLPAPPRDWSECQEPYEREDDALPEGHEPPGYDIDPEVQRTLAELRTDLDEFSDDEAYALMAAGYAMTRVELPRALPGLECAQEPPWEQPEDWPFLPALARIGEPAAETGLAETLSRGRWRFLRSYHAWRRRRRKGSWDNGELGARG